MMKTTNRILILMVIMCFIACKNQMHVITLYVNTDKIEQSSIEAHANFGQPMGIENKDFRTNVRKGDLVIWQGISISDASDMVKITSIDHESGDMLINQKALRGKSVISELVVGKIKLQPGNEKEYLEEKYSLEFTVSNKEGTFKIDPKIRSHQ